MKEKNEKGGALITIILLIIIVALGCYIVFCLKNPTKVESRENQGLIVLDSVECKGEYDKTFMVKLKNNSDKPVINKTPTIIYYDKNNMPFHEAWGPRISYMEPGAVRIVQFYDTIDDYDRMEYGFFNRDDDLTFEDLRDQVTYEVNKTDDEGVEILSIKGENKTDKNIDVDFEVGYYDGDKLIYAESFTESIDPKGKIDTYFLYDTEYADGTKFPEGFTYEVKLNEAVETKDEWFEDESSTSESDIDVSTLSDDEKIEHLLFQQFKDFYGDKMDSAKIIVTKKYTAKDVDKNEFLKDLKLGENDIAFEVSIDFLPSDPEYAIEFTVPNGVEDEETGWVHEASRLGVLRVEDGTYRISDLGTGW